MQGHLGTARQRPVANGDFWPILAFRDSRKSANIGRLITQFCHWRANNEESFNRWIALQR